MSKSLADAGLKDFADIAKFADQLDSTIYGIEPGNDGNRLILDMIDKNAFGLGDFELRESSEQAMLAQAKRAERSGEGIVFLGWEPHPMNANIKMAYLTGGDDVFGPDFGGATVYTNVRAGYVDGVPERGQVPAEPRIQPRRWRTRSWARSSTTARIRRTRPRPGWQANPDVLDAWLAGRDDARRRATALAAVRAALGV